MAQVMLLAVGFAAVLVLSLRLSWRMRDEAHETLESHLPAIGFGVGLMGLIFVGNAYLNNKQETFPFSLAGVMWISIIQGLTSCHLVERGRRVRT